MTLIILIWIVLVLCEVYRHWYLIEISRISPNRVLSAILRSLAAGILWSISPLIYHMNLDQWWAIPIMEVFVFWFLFDPILNKSRGKSLFYLGKGKAIDRVQENNIGGYPAFCFKFILAFAGVLLCYTGLNAVIYGNW